MPLNLSDLQMQIANSFTRTQLHLVIASHHHLGVKDNVEAEDYRPNYSKDQSYVSILQHNLRSLRNHSLIITWGKKAAMNPANTKTTRTQSKAPEHHIKILDSVKGIMYPSLIKLKSIS